MRAKPTALGWLDIEVSTAPEWDQAQMRRLARHLGYVVEMASEVSLIPLVDIVRSADADALIVPSPDHLDPLMLNALLSVADVETVLPRLSFARWNPAMGAVTVPDHRPNRDR
ncbi:hypothetical protein ACIRRA_39645 [Nocardia sp. NPDC101769]|uniref:hypothetical protein n=1 Tax=Nocardia sp. NPDC101769 TaxID=3364333 RepID=UPI0037F95855